MMQKSIFLVSIGLFCVGECVSSGKFISIKEAPYYVSLIFGNDSFCGGSIISEHWVITAGHCTDTSVIDITNVRTGVSSQFKNGMMYGIEKVIVHGDYEISDKCSYDVALIKLKDPITFSEFQQPIKLRSKRPSTGEHVILSGLGSQGNASGETIVLKQVVILVTEQYTCDPSPEIYNEDVFCAGGNGFNACPSDSGGPAVIDNELAGLMSYRPECAYQPPEKSGAYQRIDLHLDWIFKHTGIH